MEETNAFETEQIKEMGAFKRIVNIFFEPGKVFKSILQKPKILIPLMLIILGFTLLAIPNIPLLEEYTRETYEKMFNNEDFMKTQKMTREQAEMSIEQAVGLIKITSIAGALFIPLVILIQTAIFFGLFKLLKGTGTFIQTFAVFIYSHIIYLLGEAVRTVNVLISGKVDVTNSLALLLPDDKTNYLYNFLNSLDLFGLWAFIVTAMGLAIIHNVSKKKAYVWVISICIAFIVFSSAITTFQAITMYNQFGITM